MASQTLQLQTRSLAESLALLPPSRRNAEIRNLGNHNAEKLLYQWRGFWARPSQLAPGTRGAALQRKDWRYWLVQAGRGFGKTRTGAECVREWAAVPGEITHLVGPTAADTRDVMVTGPSGVLSCYPPNERPNYEPSKRLLTWANGHIAKTFSADEPERLRGPQCHNFWVDELASWRYEDAWDQLLFGLRLGDNPCGVITTTPKPINLVRQLIANPHTVVTRGSSYDNRANLASAFFDEIIRKYEGTRIGRQELLAELLEDIPGALWTRDLIERARVDTMPPLARVVVAIDPAVSNNATSAETGIIAVGITERLHAYVIEDVSGRYSPRDWALAAIKLAAKWQADRIVAETNNGGDLVESNLRAISPILPFRAVRATRGKVTRAEPAAALYEQGRVHHFGMLDKLEDQLCTWTPDSGEKSPDRLDALVWALYDLLIAPEELKMAITPYERVQISQY